MSYEVMWGYYTGGWGGSNYPLDSNPTELVYCDLIWPTELTSLGEYFRGMVRVEHSQDRIRHDAARRRAGASQAMQLEQRV